MKIPPIAYLGHQVEPLTDGGYCFLDFHLAVHYPPSNSDYVVDSRPYSQGSSYAQLTIFFLYAICLLFVRFLSERAPIPLCLAYAYM